VKKEPKEKHITTLVLPAELLERIDNYRFDRHFPTRAEAIRHLINYALKQNPGR